MTFTQFSTNEGFCSRCGEDICPHGLCYCGDQEGRCRDCSRRKQLEYEAEREARWQRDVIGPLCGFGAEVSDDKPS